MARRGIAKLPIVVSTEKALEIFQLLADVNRKIGRMKSEFSHDPPPKIIIPINFTQQNI